MAKTQKKKASETDEVKAPKAKGLFDHINEIRMGKNPDYFKTLSDADKKSWSNYMICRFLSMQPDIVDAINDIQMYQDKLAPEHFYQLCIAVVPKGRGYYPYIKNQSEKYGSELLRLLCIHFEESERNVLEYLSILPHEELKKIVGLYGYSEKEIAELVEG